MPLLQRAKPAEGTSIRGAAKTRGALSVAGGAKRKREGNAAAAGTDTDAKPKAGAKKSKNQEGES